MRLAVTGRAFKLNQVEYLDGYFSFIVDKYIYTYIYLYTVGTMRIERAASVHCAR